MGAERLKRCRSFYSHICDPEQKLNWFNPISVCLRFFFSNQRRKKSSNKRRYSVCHMSISKVTDRFSIFCGICNYKQVRMIYNLVQMFDFYAAVFKVAPDSCFQGVFSDSFLSVKSIMLKLNGDKWLCFHRDISGAEFVISRLVGSYWLQKGVKM